ncbi:MAG TPA: toll/interleukin-1 receptor domain-containing protein [Flavobacteriales bacterium]|nr:toll/interleukin-1 receptor domain-containing protein [Flavobacteriales bacterium]
MAKDEYDFDVFLSHSSKDKSRLGRLAKALAKQGLRVWFDEWAIKPGDDIMRAVERGLEVSRTLVLCMTRNAFGSDWVSLERNTTLFRDPSNTERRFVPILMRNCAIPDVIRRYRYIDYQSESRAALEQLVRACGGSEDKGGAEPEAEHEAEIGRLRGLVRARRREWDRLKADFEHAASEYSGLKFSIFAIDLRVAVQNDKFESPNHAINLWQYYGRFNSETVGKIASSSITRFGISGAEVSAYGLIIGQRTEHFCRMAERAGDLVPDRLSDPLLSNVGKAFSEKGNWMVVANRHPLAKWLNLMLIAAREMHPERNEIWPASIDPYAASLTVFDIFLDGDDD